MKVMQYYCNSSFPCLATKKNESCINILKCSLITLSMYLRVIDMFSFEKAHIQQYHDMIDTNSSFKSFPYDIKYDIA